MPSLLRTNVAYAIGGVANSLALFLLIPFLVATLSPSDYGTWGLFEVLVLVVTMVSLVGLDVGMMRLYWGASDAEKRRQTIGTVLIGAIGWGLVILALLIGAAWLVSTQPMLAKATNFDFGFQALTLVSAIGVTEGWFALLLTLFRIRENAVEYVTFSFIRMVLFVGLVIGGVYYEGGVTGALWGRLGASVIAILLVLPIIHRHISLKWHRTTWQQVLQYGLPLLPTNFAAYLLLASDRYFLNLFYSTEVVAVYTFMYKVATTVDIMIIRPFALDWAPRRFKIAVRPDAEEAYGRALLLFLWAALFFALCVMAGTDLVYQWLGKQGYEAGRPLVPIILLSFIVYGLSYPLNIGMLIKDKTVLIPPVSWAAAIVCVLLNLWWIPLYGMTGAAWATLVSYSIYTALLTLVSQRLYPVRYSLTGIAEIVIAAGVGSVALYALNQWAGLPLEVATSIKVLAVSVIMLGVGYHLFNDQLWQKGTAIIPAEAKQ